MIHIYKPDNTDYEHNGDITLLPSAATTHAILNGAWTEELTHPIDSEGRWKYITEEAVIKMPSFNGDQLYRIKEVSKQDSGVTATMEPIFYDAMNDCFLEDVRPTGKNGKDALDIMLAPNSKYSGQSDITRASTAYYQYVNFMEALNGDIDQNFIDRWGGEILFDNFTVIVNERVGADNGVELRYGKNIPQDGMSYEVDIRDVVTRIYPKAYNGRTMTGNGHVDSPLIENYPTVKTVTMTFENVKLAEDLQGDPEDTDIVCDTQEELDAALTAQCNAQYEAGIDKPVVTINADMVLLQNTEQYKDVEMLESVSLGDTIHCINTHLDITTDARVIELEYDSIRKKVTAVTIGEFGYQYFDGITSSSQKIDSVIAPNGSLMAEKVQGILNGIYTQLRLQSTAAQKVDGNAFLIEDTDEESDLYGAMVWGTQGLQLATSRTADGKNWDWTTAVTAKGIVASVIVSGILTDKEGKNYWNLDTGEFRLSAEAFKVDDQTVQDYVDGQIDEKIAQIRTLTMQLSNEFTGVATDSNGSGGDYSDCYTDVSLYIGSTDITESDAVQWTINPSAGVTGNWNEAQHRYSITYLSGDNGTVSISATYSGLVITKTFAIAKVKQGVQGNTGIQGPPGEDGKSLYTWIKYADSPTSGMSDNPSGKDYIGIAYNKTTPRESENYSDYAWSLYKGDQGIQGVPGENGETYYTWIKYATSATGANMSDDPTGKTYLGIAYNKTTPTESTDPSDYTWSLFQGPQGEKGEQGIPGTNGTDGKTSYFHIKYSANANGNPMSETPNTYIGTYVDFTQADSNDYTDYTWSRFEGMQGEQGIPGTNGANGKTSYLHIKYSDDGGKTFTANNGETPGKYIGQYVDFTKADSANVNRYTWSLFQGPQGEQGIPGTNGTDGRTSYFHIKYSANASGNPMSETPNTYIGTYVDFTQADSNDYTDYTWSRFEGMQGEQGIPGTNGANGKTSYLHIKYSDDGGKTFTANNGETPGKYIGQYVDFTKADSANVNRYTWSLTQGEDGRVYMIQASTQVLSQGADDAFTPPTVTFSAYYRDGQSASRTAYAGRFIIQETTDGTSYVTRWTSAANQTSVTYTPYSKNVKNIRCTLYAAGGTKNALDMQGVAIVRDIDNLTQEEVFNILTNNGASQGIYMQDGNLYINGTYIKGGTISGQTIEGGSIEITYQDDDGNPVIAFVANHNGVGLGPNGQFLTYYSGDDFLSLYGEMRIMSGGLTSYNGAQKAVQMVGNSIIFYDWTGSGDEVGRIGAVKRNSDGRVGIDVWCDKGDFLSFGYANEQGSADSITPVIRIDSQDTSGPPWIRGGYTGTIRAIYNGYGEFVQIHVKNGIITGRTLP